MKKMVVLIFLILIVSLWAGTNKSVLISITDVGAGPASAGSYDFEAWVGDRTNDVLTPSTTGCGLLEITETYSCWFIQLELANLNYTWTDGEVLHVKVWEDEVPLTSQPQAEKDFTLNYAALQFYTPDGVGEGVDGTGIELANPPLAAVSPVPDGTSPIASGDIDSTTLSWSLAAEDNTTHFDVYLSTDSTEVNELSSGAKKVTNQAVGTTSYDPTLGFSKTYYWRVVSKNDNSNISVNGTIWSFETSDEIIEQTVTGGQLNTFTFTGGEIGGDDVIPATVGFTPATSGTREAGIVSVRKYETPPATVPCPEYALNVLFDLDIGDYTGDGNVTISFEWDNLGFEGNNFNLYYYNGNWNTYSGTPQWDDDDTDGDGFSVEFTTNDIYSFDDAEGNSTWMISDGSTSSPLQPTIPQLSSVSKSGSNIEIIWSASTAASSYDVLRSTDPYSGSWTTVATDHGSTTWSTALDENTNYYYKIVAKGGTLSSDDSEVAGYVKYSMSPTAQTDNNIIVYSMDMGFSTAEDLRASIPNCQSISKWNVVTQDFSTYIQNELEANFELEQGAAYMVSISAESDWYCCGTLFDPVSFSLSTTSETDLNWISVPLDMDYTTASDIITSSADTVSGQPINRINFVAYYNVSEQVWIGYASYYPETLNFAVTPGMGILVNLTMGPYTWPVRD